MKINYLSIILLLLSNRQPLPLTFAWPMRAEMLGPQ
jgi:hypothetical protein